jgi:hypothetical protein
MFKTVPGGGFYGDGDKIWEALSSDSERNFYLLPDIAGLKLVGMMKSVLTSQFKSVLYVLFMLSIDGMASYTSSCRLKPKPSTGVCFS